MSDSFFHLKQGNQFEPKEIFKEIFQIIKKHHQNKKLNVLDAGCASGELPCFFKDNVNINKIYGLDISSELINNACKRFKDIEFIVADVKNFKLDEKFDVITMVSVLSYFNNPYEVMANALSHLKENGLLIITGIFNENIDVRLKYKLDGESEWKENNVLNQFSKKSITEFLDKGGYKYKFTTQVMPFGLKPKESPIRSWTVNLNGKRYMMNGLQLAYNIEILTIVKR